MHVWLHALWICLLALFFGCATPPPDHSAYEPQEGDVLFQSLPESPLVQAIEGATHSPYSHCGLVTRVGERWVVLEAIGPVRYTPLEAWIGQGRDARFDAYRLDPRWAPRIPAMISVAERYLGRPYDIHYEFGDEAIYCSELVYKAAQEGLGESLGTVQRLGELDWQDHRQVILEIEGTVPEDRLMITPRALAEAPALRCVYRSIPLR